MCDLTQPLPCGVGPCRGRRGQMRASDVPSARAGPWGLHRGHVDVDVPDRPRRLGRALNDVLARGHDAALDHRHDVLVHF